VYEALNLGAHIDMMTMLVIFIAAPGLGIETPGRVLP
jgi:hypothetical protein